MKIGPKYKIARRLGATVFEKTQTQKYALSAEKKGKVRRERNRTDFGLQLTEKQKARFFYGVTEKQFKNYVKKVLAKKASLKSTSPSNDLFSMLESRLDNAVWRMGIAPTHLASRQMVAHGHITINGKRVYSPSYTLSVGDKIGIREGSRKSKMFNKDENEEKTESPAWISYDKSKMEGVVKGKPALGNAEILFDIGKVIQFYQR